MVPRVGYTVTELDANGVKVTIAEKCVVPMGINQALTTGATIERRKQLHA